MPWTEEPDPLVFGHRLRHFRRRAGLTLDELGGRIGKPASYLSLVENGKREPKLSLITALASVLDVETSELLSSEPPTRRAELEVALERAQQDPLYAELGLPYLKPSAKLPDSALEHIVGLYEELRRRSDVRAATPEEARKANAALRSELEQRDLYLGELEELARTTLEAVGYSGGAVSQRTLQDIAAHYGFTINLAGDLPVSVRSVTDLRHRRIYIPQRNALRTRAARSVVLRTLGHFALGHRDPGDFGEFLRQRLQASYFASAVLVPESTAVPFLLDAKERRDLSVEDLKEVSYVSYEMAAHRFTNLATRHLSIPTHLVRADEEGVMWKAYANDGVPFPQDADGAIEGQRVCRYWGTRQVFTSDDKFAIHYQYTDTPAGTFWCSTHVEADRQPPHAVTVGTRFDHAQYFRGRETDRHAVSRCPDQECCRRPPGDLASRWQGRTWPSTKARSHVLAALPAGTFPGVDLTEIYEFLERKSG